MAALERDGLVEQRQSPPQGVGKPAYVYTLTTEADALLPKAYAENAIDPTGIGRVLGLTEMGEIEMALAEEAAAVAGEIPTCAPPVAPTADSVANSHVMEVALEPGQGREIKLVMREGARVNYEWTVEGGVVNSDTHADRPGTPYHGYAKGRNQASDQGVLVAAFDGKHGWFWRNRSTAPVTVTLRTSGDYHDLQEVK